MKIILHRESYRLRTSGPLFTAFISDRKEENILPGTAFRKKQSHKRLLN